MAAGSLSVVIPAFRAAGTLKRTLTSCLEEIAPSDIIVVLDGPDTALEEVARSCDDAVRVLVLPTPGGAPVCRNVGLCMVETPFVMFLDADDYVEAGFLKGAVSSALRTNADLVLGSFAFELPDGTRLPVDVESRYADGSAATVLRRWLSGDYTPPCAVVWRTDFVRGIGGWDRTLAKNQDGDLIYRGLLAEPRIARTTTGLGIYVQADNPNRITLRNTARTLYSQLVVLEKVRARLPELDFDPHRELALAYYSLARLAFSGGFDDFGADAERTARNLGLAGQPGNRPHNMLASLFGLRGKQRLTSRLRSALRFVTMPRAGNSP